MDLNRRADCVDKSSSDGYDACLVPYRTTQFFVSGATLL